MSELGEFAAALVTISCALVLLFWLVLLAGWAEVWEDPDDEETDDA